MLGQVKKAFQTPATRLKWWEVVFLVVSAAAVLWGAILTLQQQQLAQRMVRLHVIANSDSAGDQTLKLMVRDAVLTRVSDWMAGVENPKEAEQVLAERLTELEAVGAKVVWQAGYSYPVKVQLETTHFPTKYYDGFALPAGDYRALRVVIGAGEGENWWCVVFPTLCVAPASEWEATAVSGGMNDSEVALMAGESEGYILKFKCLEWLDWLKERLR